jgi:probable HAF family extracellular repeat protein
MWSWRRVRLGVAPKRYTTTAFLPTNPTEKGDRMKFKQWTPVVVMTLFAALTMPVWTAAQDNPSQDHKSKHHHYKLIDLGTFGGPSSFVSNPFSLTLNNRGMVAGWAETPTPDPYAPNCLDSDCFVPHAFQWQNGVLNDLGTLPGGSGSFVGWINDRGVSVGASENGLIDPLTGYPQLNAVVWKDGQIVNLGTLGGNQSQAFAINDRGQVVGGALNAILDPFSNNLTLNFLLFAPSATQVHAFLWQDGVMQDLGTLGGPDSIAGAVNERGQVAGLSFTNSTPNPTTGMPTLDPFLWQDGTMIDLGTLGGTLGFADDVNNEGQVVGQSNLPGDMTSHPFLWDKKKGLIDLGTFGGSYGSALWLNDAGEVVGVANFPGDKLRDGFLWKNGVLTDLGNLGKTSLAEVINSSGQIVGASRIDSTTVHAFLWENGGPMVDLNLLVPPGSALTLTEALFINDRGEIDGLGKLASGDIHVFLLIPCDEKHPGECEDYSMIEAPAQQTSHSTATRQGSESPADTETPSRNRVGRRFHVPGQPAVPRD